MILRCVLVGLIACVLLVQQLCAQVDQENWRPDQIGGGFSSFGLQQEFTPSLNALDTVELWIPDGILNPAPYIGGAAAVSIRQGGVGGPIIAASAPANIVPFYTGSILFSFSEPVSLVPGQLYALQLFSVSESTFPHLAANFPASRPGYPGGRLFTLDGIWDQDLIFREGIAIPEPSSSILLAVGLGVIFVAAGMRKRAQDKTEP